MPFQPIVSPFALSFSNGDDYCGTPWRPHLVVLPGVILPYINPQRRSGQAAPGA